MALGRDLTSVMSHWGSHSPSLAHGLAALWPGMPPGNPAAAPVRGPSFTRSRAGLGSGGPCAAPGGTATTAAVKEEQTHTSPESITCQELTPPWGGGGRGGGETPQGWNLDPCAPRHCAHRSGSRGAPGAAASGQAQPPLPKGVLRCKNRVQQSGVLCGAHQRLGLCPL